MVITDLEHVVSQAALSPRLLKALHYLQQIPEQTLADGRVEIDGAHVFAIVQTYETVVSDTWKLEGHHSYIDVQYVASGVEILGWAPSKGVPMSTPYDDATDAWFGILPSTEVTPVRLSAGQLAILYPSDAHAPGRAVDAPCLVRKIVVKVAVPGQLS